MKSWNATHGACSRRRPRARPPSPETCSAASPCRPGFWEDRCRGPRPSPLPAVGLTSLTPLPSSRGISTSCESYGICSLTDSCCEQPLASRGGCGLQSHKEPENGASFCRVQDERRAPDGAADVDGGSQRGLAVNQRGHLPARQPVQLAEAAHQRRAAAQAGVRRHVRKDVAQDAQRSFQAPPPSVQDISPTVQQQGGGGHPTFCWLPDLGGLPFPVAAAEPYTAEGPLSASRACRRPTTRPTTRGPDRRNSRRRPRRPRGEDPGRTARNRDPACSTPSTSSAPPRRWRTKLSQSTRRSSTRLG